MPAATRKADTGAGHECHFPPTKATEGSSDVFIDGKAALRVGDAYEEHTCPIHGGAHPRKLAKGSPTVFINGKPAGRIGDAIDCGGEAQTGSETVFMDDNAKN